MSQSIMIIGAGPGIGQAVAERFGREGWSLVLTGRAADRLATLAAELLAAGITAYTVAADATDPAALRAAIVEADRLTGGLSAIHYNAAIVRQQDLFSMTDDEVAGDLAISITGGLQTIRAAVAQFGARGGTILVTGGGLGVNPHESYATLGVGKAAMRNIVQALAEPLAARGIRIALATVATLIAPGSPEAKGVADTFWHLATDANAGWEATYPAPAGPPLTLIARLTAKPEQAEALGAGLRALIEPTLREDGAIGYTLHRDNDDPNAWILYETWRSRADLDAHFEQPYTKALMTRFPEMLAREMELSFATALAASG
ncbi:NAD(P)-dependent dehydrogenase (short-subunit alcohol dehydrogenase family) [Sphingomonas zeicaulis]|uniref:SDR family NAD(P)-dependent oxidoreductase n=1 Tax=Sphingomonas zeicaulis TaxID=1632740 RepID=UPI003D1D31E9